MKELPLPLITFFISIAVLALYLFYKASGNRNLLFVLVGWTAIQSVASFFEFFAPTDLMPPRLTLLVVPPLLLLTVLCILPAGRRFLDGFNSKTLTLLHVLRIPVEATLFLLFTYQVMPKLMTFEGRNFDILSGMTAPVIYYFGFVKKKLSKQVILAWNFCALGILAFTVINGILSAPTPLQQFGFDQPSIAVLHFPMTLLPGLVVPIVYYAHIITIRQLLSTRISVHLNEEKPNTTLQEVKNDRTPVSL